MVSGRLGKRNHATQLLSWGAGPFPPSNPTGIPARPGCQPAGSVRGSCHVLPGPSTCSCGSTSPGARPLQQTSSYRRARCGLCSSGEGAPLTPQRARYPVTGADAHRVRLTLQLRPGGPRALGSPAARGLGPLSAPGPPWESQTRATDPSAPTCPSARQHAAWLLFRGHTGWGGGGEGEAKAGVKGDARREGRPIQARVKAHAKATDTAHASAARGPPDDPAPPAHAARCRPAPHRALLTGPPPALRGSQRGCPSAGPRGASLSGPRPRKRPPPQDCASVSGLQARGRTSGSAGVTTPR